jgi:DNA-binding NarL/FixJ family response regulator
MLIVDDHPLTRDGLTALLSGNGFEILGEAAGGREAIELARELQPDVILLDLSMPDLDGLSALPELRTAAPACEVVVLTASGDEENLLAAIRGGAAGYLLKTEPPERLVEFLHSAVRGEAALSGAVARRLLEQVRTGARPDAGIPDTVAGRLSISERTRSRSGSSSRSTRCARTSRACCGSSRSRPAARRSRSSPLLVRKPGSPCSFAEVRGSPLFFWAVASNPSSVLRESVERGADQARQRPQVVAALEDGGDPRRERG